MVSIYNLKKYFQKALRPFINILFKLKLTPNMITVTAVVLSCTVGLCLALVKERHHIFLAFPAFLFIRMALNAIDGLLAREYSMQSDLGAVLNELGDMVSDAALYMSLAFVTEFDPKLITTIVILSLISEMCGIMAYKFGKDRNYDGPCGKSDRAFIFSLMSLALFFKFSIVRYFDMIQWGIILLLIITIYNRIKSSLAENRICAI